MNYQQKFEARGDINLNLPKMSQPLRSLAMVKHVWGRAWKRRKG